MPAPFFPGLWNAVVPILKERPFGLGHPEGNHGEEIKDDYFHLANTPTHRVMRGLYKCPQTRFPYEQLVEANGRRSLDQPEDQLLHAGIFDQGRYFNVFIEYAKASPTAIESFKVA